MADAAGFFLGAKSDTREKYQVPSFMAHMCIFFYYRPGRHICLWGTREIQTNRVSAGYPRPFQSKSNESEYVQHPLDERQDPHDIHGDLKDGGNDDQAPSSNNDNLRRRLVQSSGYRRYQLLPVQYRKPQTRKIIGRIAT